MGFRPFTYKEKELRTRETDMLGVKELINVTLLNRHSKAATPPKRVISDTALRHYSWLLLFRPPSALLPLCLPLPLPPSLSLFLPVPHPPLTPVKGWQLCISLKSALNDISGLVAFFLFCWHKFHSSETKMETHGRVRDFYLFEKVTCELFLLYWTRKHKR